MSEKIDPREVLTYLNELGYTNISAQQLKEFIKDLKKIIKYDSRYGGAPANDMEEQSHFGEERDSYCECSGSNDKENHDNVNSSDKENQKDNLQNQTTKIDNAKNTQKDKHIAVHIYDKKGRQYLDHEHCIHINSLDAKISQFDQGRIKMPSILCSGSKPETTESTIKSIPPCSTREIMHSRASKASSKDRKSKVTFIRPAISKPSFNKSDPVALYHYYQSEWKKTKIPGQDSRDDLRWAIRERMLSGPRVEVKSRCNIQRCGWSR